ncbi:HlyD family efflux transporter periplasmic adaptor subunit [Facklamia sp. P9177]|uniref:HlyD family efflux transporter periplasmic adaptor subunit n=1 Tax=Facklamia sp. P9177 TaxID=3421945 RepID=UPI003D168B26
MKLYNKQDLKNSRIFFDRKPPKFMIFLIYFLIFIVLLVGFASSKIKKNYIVKAQGIVADKGINYISSNVNGTVVEILKTEGAYVKENETILIISNGDEKVQRKEQEKILENNKEKIDLLNKYRESLDKKENLLKDEGAEQEYYGKIEYYLSSLNMEKNNSKYTQEDINKKTEKIKAKTDEKTKNDSTLSKLKENKDYYAELVTYYENLNYEILDLEEEISKLKQEENLDLELIELKENILKDKKHEYRENSKALENKSKAESEYENAKSKIESLTGEIEGLKEELYQINRQKDTPGQSEQIYFQFVNEIGAEIKTIEKTNDDIQLNISVLEKRDNNYELKSTKEGRIHYLNPIKEGLNVQMNQALIELSTDSSENYYIDTYIEVTDISKVKENQNVDVAILGINTYKYGTLNGVVKNIESSAINIQDSEGGKNFYKAKIEISEKELSKNGENIKLLLSMPVEARIIYDKETYLEYLLEKLSFKE